MDYLSELESGILQCDRRQLAKAITLVESENPQKRELGRDLIARLSQHQKRSKRVGISGPPGVGKSSFIERIGMTLLNQGQKIAVLAIDPSSPVSGGSILGDKTRMQELAAHQDSFIRPSPSGRTTGGVARNTREAILILEAAGFDYIFVETVGVGQADYTCESMVDLFITLHLPGSGDDLQGIKKGILELSQMVIVTKADGDQKHQAELARLDLESAFHFLPPRNPERQILLVSSRQNLGFAEVISSIENFFEWYWLDNRHTEKRHKQSIDWFHEEITAQFQEKITGDPYIQSLIRQHEGELFNNKPASHLASTVLQEIFHHLSVAINQTKN